ncbi:hypothetical protein [uncultured Thiodictyon sp.]|uniref:hypothetical protein n=1 Tax=uncultured Thiodictyon sp. TaxID=1846217 RepID=UPI0025D974EB|nr:hypothetical protein [uncultured Thiodictyon sp.]
MNCRHTRYRGGKGPCRYWLAPLLLTAPLFAWVYPLPAQTASDPQSQDASPGRIAKKRFVDTGEPRSVIHGGIRYRELRWGKERGLGQNGGYILATREATGEELWLRKVYDIRYDAAMESDKQDVFITDMQLDWLGNVLTLRNERGERFTLDLKTREVAPLRR